MTSSDVDHFQVLGVPRTAQTAEVKRAYHRLALRWHPDKNPSDREVAEHRFKQISLAYEVLIDPRQRSQYERQGAWACAPAPREKTAEEKAEEQKFTCPDTGKGEFETLFGSYPETSDACKTAEEMLGQMGSMDFADAMFRFCQQKMQEAMAQDVAKPASSPTASTCSPRDSDASSSSSSSPAPAVVIPKTKRRSGSAASDGGSTRVSEDDLTSQPLEEEEKEGKLPTLRDELKELQAEDERRVILVRGINRIGFESKDALEAFFAGPDLVKVLVTHNKAKASGRRRERLRPAAIGFVVMSSVEAVEAALARGELREISGVEVRVQRFTHGGMHAAAPVA